MASSRFPKLYSALPPGYISRSTISILFGGGSLFVGIQLFSGNERFYREWAMPLVHRLFEPELAHRFAVKMAKYGMFIGYAENRKEYPELRCTLFGREVANPIGLAAGFDKNAEALTGLRHAGFGFIECGSVTPRPQNGNPRPRVFRLTEDKAVINSYGFNSDGVGPVVGRVKKEFDPSSVVLLGINLGKNKTSAEAVHDYEIGINHFAPHCDYLVINISSPNTPGLRALQSKRELAELLGTLKETLERATKNAPHHTGRRPQLLVKISPDLSPQDMKDVAEVCTDRRLRVDGLIVFNTTIQRPPALISPEADRSGGLSGAPLHALSTRCIGEMYRLTRGQLPIIGCGGVGSGADAYAMIRAGASAVQLYTALVYQGFPVVGRVKRELVELLHRDGYDHVSDAVGAQHFEDKKRENK